LTSNAQAGRATPPPGHDGDGSSSPLVFPAARGSREIFLLSLVANLIAWPMAYLMMGRWLQDFPCRDSMSPMIFFSAAAPAAI